MADSELFQAVKALVRRLRQFFTPHGHPPGLPKWIVPCSKGQHENHPLKGCKANFGWLLGDPDGDPVLAYAVESFESLRKTALALKRVEALIDVSDRRGGHFRVAWKRLLQARWIKTLNIETAQSEANDWQEEHMAGFSSAAIDRRLLAGLVEAAGINQGSLRHASGAIRQPGVKKDRLTDSRDKWVYDQCCAAVAYDTIARRLSKKNPKWGPIKTKQGILDCAKRYARRNGLPMPPSRQDR